MNKLLKRLLPYLLVLGVFVSLILLVIDRGNHLPSPVAATGATQTAAPAASTSLLHNLQHPLGLLLLQVLVIVSIARLFGALAKRLRQPAVVGEIIAGICLGPSLLGWLWPASATWLFPASSLQSLSFLGQIGLAFFMFVVGMQMDPANMKHKAPHAVMISHVSIVFPFFLGVALAYYLYPQFAPARTGFIPFALFTGISMSITAFPVLARIVQERGLSGTPVGSLAITCAAADDITAWCLLAAVVATARSGSLAGSLPTVGLALAFVCVMIFAVKPLLEKTIRRLIDKGGRQQMVTLVFITMLLSAWTAEVIGIHALFGAFFAGAVMPSNVSVKKMIADRIEDVSMLLLLPIFFAFTGLRTQVGLVSGGQMWWTFALVMLVAVGGKLCGSALTARIMGLSWRDSMSIGALMNTRGLMELIVLNIGYELGIFTPPVFALMVLMALGTTFMTGPLLDLFYRPALPAPANAALVKSPHDALSVAPAGEEVA